MAITPRIDDPNREEALKKMPRRDTKAFLEQKQKSIKEGLEIALKLVKSTREQLIKEYKGKEKVSSMKKEDILIKVLEGKLKA